MPAPTKKYLPDEITLRVGGDLIKGFAPGEFITIEEQSERIVSVVGTDGEVAVSRVLDRRATITFKLLQTSDSNDVFATMMQQNQDGPGLPGVRDLYIRDRQGRSIHEAPVCMVMQAPTVSYDREATSREWQILATSLSNNIKGASVI